MLIDLPLPTLGLVITSAAIDSINPCAIGVLVLMISLILGSRKNTQQVVIYGLAYIFAIFVTYLLTGLGLLYFLSSVPLKVTEYISLAVGSVIVILGLVEIKDYFWYGRGFSLAIPATFTHKIHKLAKNITLPGVILTGVFVAAVELPCTGAPYLAIITVLSLNFNLSAFLMLVLYNLIFILPLVVILLLITSGTKLHLIKSWKQNSRRVMRLTIGLLLIALGWLLILLSNGTINLG